jgi:mevalonate kinase
VTDPIPARPIPLAARAPGKCVLFGEHAVVHGKPELVLAIDLYTQVALRPGPELRLNGNPEVARSHRYLSRAMADLWAGGDPLDVVAVSRIPRASGLGSSAAFVAALAAGLGAARGGRDRPALAQACFTIEREAQGVGSPGDTSAAVAGGYIGLNSAASSSGEKLWEVAAGTERWTVHRVPDPGWVWVVAYTGVPKDTGTTVRAVRERLRRPDGPALLERFAETAEAGIRAVLSEDRDEVGRLLMANHELLRDLGVSHPRLEALLEAARPAALGSKLTGAGAGGSVVALPRPQMEIDLVRRLARAGGVPYAVRPAPAGAELV